MESLTGGLLANSITDVPGSPSYFRGGMVVYSNESAIASGVPAAIVENYGIISQEMAGAMARVARDLLKADIGIGITGVAGPEEVEGKPVGLIHIAIALDETVRHFPGRWPPRRPVIRRRSASTALIELLRLLKAL